MDEHEKAGALVIGRVGAHNVDRLPAETVDLLVKFIADAIKEAVEAETERCAKVAGAHVICDWSKLPGRAVDDSYGRQIATAIRARPRA